MLEINYQLEKRCWGQIKKEDLCTLFPELCSFVYFSWNKEEVRLAATNRCPSFIVLCLCKQLLGKWNLKPFDSYSPFYHSITACVRWSLVLIIYAGSYMKMKTDCSFMAFSDQGKGQLLINLLSFWLYGFLVFQLMPAEKNKNKYTYIY